MLLIIDNLRRYRVVYKRPVVTSHLIDYETFSCSGYYDLLSS